MAAHAIHPLRISTLHGQRTPDGRRTCTRPKARWGALLSSAQLSRPAHAAGTASLTSASEWKSGFIEPCSDTCSARSFRSTTCAATHTSAVTKLKHQLLRLRGVETPNSSEEVSVHAPVSTSAAAWHAPGCRRSPPSEIPPAVHGPQLPQQWPARPMRRVCRTTAKPPPSCAHRWR